MKKLLTSIFLLFQFSLFAQIQWAQVGTIWYYDNIGVSSVSYVKYEVVKDTLLGGKQAGKIQKTSKSYEGKIVNLGVEFTYMENKKVYFWNKNHYYLLYDFGAKEGDSWTLKTFVSNHCTQDTVSRVIVKKIEKKVIDGFTFNAFTTIPDDTSKLAFPGEVIENIGCLDYMFPRVNPWCLADYGPPTGLRCFISPQTGTIHFNVRGKYYPQCDTVYRTGIESEIETNSVTIYPNPTNESFTISASANIIEQAEIMDSNGKVVYHIVCKNKSELTIPSLKKGVYLVKIQINKSFIYKKIIVL